MTGKAMIQALVIQPDGSREVKYIDGGLDSLQAAVGGYIEAIGNGGEWTAYVNEEGKLSNPPLPINPRASKLALTLGWQFLQGDYLAGPVVFLGPPTGNGDDTSAPAWLIDLAEGVEA